MSPRIITICLSSLLALSACTSSDSSDEAPTSTTVAPPSVTTVDAPTTTEIAESTTTLAPVTGTVTPPRYQIVGRAPTDAGGDEVVVLLDPSSYDSLSDIDLFDIVAEVVELFPPVATLHIVDEATAANTVTDPDASDAERASLEAHYFARLEDGFQIVYLGPFASSGTAVLGS